MNRHVLPRIALVVGSTYACAYACANAPADGAGRADAAAGGGDLLGGGTSDAAGAGPAGGTTGTGGSGMGGSTGGSGAGQPPGTDPDARVAGADLGRETPDAGPAAAPDCAAWRPRFEALADDLGAALAAAGIPGGAVAVVCGADEIFARGLGATTPGGAAITPRTRFQIASSTKMLTATAAVRLAAQGVIDLNGPITAAVPFVNTQAPYARPFTWAELLSHSSGLPNEYPQGGGSDELEGFFRENGRADLWAAPGAVWNYSNNGFALAGLALERETGTPFRQLLQDTVLVPAGMEGARMRAADLLREGDYALGHAGGVGSTVGPDELYLDSDYYAPMGGVWAGALDLAAYARLLMGARPEVFDAAAVRTQTTPRIRTWYVGESYGLGMFVESGNFPVFTHGGDVAGFHTDFLVAPAAGFAFVMLVNGDYDVPYEFPWRALAEFTEFDPGPGPSGEDDPARRPLHEGVWGESASFGDFELRVRGDSLEMIRAGGASVPLTPLWLDTYSMYHAPWESEIEVYLWSEGDAPASWFVSRAGVARRLGP